ncbi:MAG: DUF2628 domain-containing protein [Alphaproteobacteria bacterium]|nr:DUF2628 domain-containing protein [Alphaproteobacteria bacterium]
MFHGLKLYTVHTKPGSDHSLTKPVFLREGFNWPAFLFTFLWALYERLWLLALVILAANFAIAAGLRTGLIDQMSGTIILLALQVIVGFSGNDALRKRMRKQGYIFQDIASGDSLLRAEQRYFDRLVA